MEKPSQLDTLAFDETREFVNRNNEIDDIQRSLRQLYNKTLDHWIINITGIPGIGKSALLQRIYDINKQQKNTVIGYAINRGSIFDWRDFILHVYGQIVELYPGLPDIRQIDSDRAIEIMAITSRKMPLLIIVDGCEYLDDEQRQMFETDFLALFAGQARILVILSSQARIRFQEYSLRRRTRYLDIGPLTLEHAREQVDTSIDDWLLQLAGGYPLANEIAIQPGNNTIDQFLSATMSAMRLRLPAMNDQLWRALQLVALLREFDIELLQQLMPLVDPSWPMMGQTDARKQIDDLIRTRLCYNDDNFRVFRFAQPVRSIVNEYVNRMGTVDVMAIRQKVIEIYKERIKNVGPSSRGRYLWEYIYHTVLYNRSSADYNSIIVGDFQKLLNDYYRSQSGRYVEYEGLARLKASLEHDTELQQFLAEHGLFNQLWQIMETFGSSSA